MAAANTDKFKKLSRRWVGQIGAGGVADNTTTTVPLASTTNLPTDTAVVVVIDRVDANGVATASLEETVIGVVSGSNLTNCVRGAEGTAQAHTAGAVVEVLVTAKGFNDLIDALLVSHTQSGALGASVVVASNVSASAITAGRIAASAVVAGNLAASSVASGNLNFTVAIGPDFTNINSITASGSHDIQLIPDTANSKVMIGSVARQGGSTTDWSSPGTNAYYQAGFIQCGTLTLGDTSNHTITFPVAFSQPPVATISLLNSSGANIVIKSISASQLVVAQGATADAGSQVFWIAIGKR